MKDENELKILVSAMLDDALTEDQARQLDEILQKDAAARETYRRLVDMHFTLNEISDSKVNDSFNDLPEPQNFPEEFRANRKRLVFFQALAACLAIAFSIAFFNTKEVKGEGVKYLPVKTPLAHISQLSPDVKWSSPQKKVGDTIYNEELILAKGSMTIVYDHGAEIKLQGPLHYSLKSL
ncbi:MAG: hypothetical protein HRT88_16505 [Lentisphaeraceae bacterium]|nr:hypothetical protein [Lentisphaeraceae bacterium]